MEPNSRLLRLTKRNSLCPSKHRECLQTRGGRALGLTHLGTHTLSLSPCGFVLQETPNHAKMCNQRHPGALSQRLPVLDCGLWFLLSPHLLTSDFLTLCFRNFSLTVVQRVHIIRSVLRDQECSESLSRNMRPQVFDNICTLRPRPCGNFWTTHIHFSEG